ncbi:hypothetical protein [Streptomyces sp. NPDC001508]|uniref:hypothetical protein n=1 Tax=Streptomyces sp. NPDC001508 TaxID=3154656 RepID=UPI00332EC8B4
MTTAEPIRIVRGPGGEVEVTGPVDAFAADVLRRAGFMFLPQLRGCWVRLPFDLGTAWESEHASWAAEMLTAARYPVHLDPDLSVPRSSHGSPSVPNHRPATTAQSPPAGRRTRN